MEMEVLELTDAQAAALLRSRTPLADVYRAWERAETHHMGQQGVPAVEDVGDGVHLMLSLIHI